MRDEEFARRFRQKYFVDPVTGCHHWIAATTLGYAATSRGAGHRWAYEQANGPIPEKHDIHHKCENTYCVNPDHLVALTRYDHLGESERFASSYSRGSEFCRNGHPWESNCFRLKNGIMRCNTCNRENTARWRAKKKAAAA